MIATRVAKTTLKLENGFSLMPNGNRSPELAESGEIFFEQRLESLLKFIRIEWHPSKLDSEG